MLYLVVLCYVCVFFFFKGAYCMPIMAPLIFGDAADDGDVCGDLFNLDDLEARDAKNCCGGLEDNKCVGKKECKAFVQNLGEEGGCW